jgi:hypothetical protein
MAALCDGGRRTVAYVFFEEPPCGLVGFEGSSTSLLGGKRLSLVGESGVAFDRGETDGEESGGLGLGHAALLDGLDYLPSKVFGVGFHPFMVAYGSNVLICAVRTILWEMHSVILTAR